MLQPFLIFKGKSNRQIATLEFMTFPTAGQYACQDKAWMDEARMHEWVVKVLKPQKDDPDVNNPSIEPPILILDAYHVHEMGSLVNLHPDDRHQGSPCPIRVHVFVSTN